MRISDWSSDVCSSDLRREDAAEDFLFQRPASPQRDAGQRIVGDGDGEAGLVAQHFVETLQQRAAAGEDDALVDDVGGQLRRGILERDADALDDRADRLRKRFGDRSEEHTSELQSLMRISYAVFCLK